MATAAPVVLSPRERLSEAVAAYRSRTPRSEALARAARRRTPLGVHSNERALEPYPLSIERAQGARLWDVDGNAYLDFGMGQGALASGHAHPRIVEAVAAQAARGTLYAFEGDRTAELSEQLTRRFGVDQVRLSSTGLEASLHAVRISRAVTGHRIVLKAEGGYHGSHDALLVSVDPLVDFAGPPDHPRSVLAGPGILSDEADRTRIIPFNDLEAARTIAREFADDVAAILVEPVAVHMGLVLPAPGYLAGLRSLADELGALLWFDEVSTGAKYPAGAAGRFGTRPDGLLLGPGIASGMPLSAIGTRAGLLDTVGPRGVAHAGTFNANPLSVAAALATLEHVLTGEYFDSAERRCRRLADGYRAAFAAAGVRAVVSHDGPSGSVAFADRPVTDWRDFARSDSARRSLFQLLALTRGLVPGGAGAPGPWTLSILHTDADVDRHLEVVEAIAPTLAGPPERGGTAGPA